MTRAGRGWLTGSCRNPLLQVCRRGCGQGAFEIGMEFRRSMCFRRFGCIPEGVGMSMGSRGSLGGTIALLAVLAAATANAACEDPPERGVNWSKCDKAK